MSGVLWSSIRGGCGMRRTEWLQDSRMQKFRDVLSRWERKELSAMEASEILGCSERQFRRYRRRYDEEGLAGLADKRLGKASARRVLSRSCACCWVTWRGSRIRGNPGRSLIPCARCCS